MKSSNSAGILLLFVATATFLGAGVQSDSGQPALPPPTPWTVVSRGANSAIWQRTTYELSPSGATVPRIHRYIELASGLNHSVNGRWLPSEAVINVLSNGTAAATNGQQQVYFPGDIAQGVINLVTPEGDQLQNRPIALSYDDGTNTVVIAVLTNSLGLVVGANQVVYPNCFDGVKADLICTYRKSGLECDVVFREQPPSPKQLGLSWQKTRLQLLTEFFNPPQPVQTVGPVSPHDGLSDTTLQFGSVTMGRGKCFMVNTAAAGRNNGPLPRVRVYKQWLQVSAGRTMLIEQTPYARISPLLQTLPTATNGTASAGSPGSVLDQVSTIRLPPPSLPTKAGTGNAKITRQLASADLAARPGVVLDYTTLSGSVTNYTFQGDTTYYISGALTVSGTTTLEGGAVIKYAPSVSAITVDTVKCKTGPYRPAVFSAKDDNSIGEPISGSSGSPSGYYASDALDVDHDGNTLLEHLRILYAETALLFRGDVTVPDTNTVRDTQIVHCYIGFDLEEYNNDQQLHFYNGLVNTALLGFTGFLWGGQAENVTVDGGDLVNDDGYGQEGFHVTNSIIANVGSFDETGGHVGLDGGYNGFYNDGTGAATFGSHANTTTSTPFKTVVGGDYYLTNDGTFYNAGTTNIDATLLADLAATTTYPPFVYSNASFSVSTTLNPQAQHDTDIPDLGYHYDPLDYIFISSQAYSNLTFTAGTAAAWSSSEGLQLEATMTVAFMGTATSPDYWVRCHTVQEQSFNGSYGPGGIASHYSNSLTNAPTAQATFTRFAMLAGRGNPFRDDTGNLNIHLNNCEFWTTGEGGYGVGLCVTNCLFDRTYIGVQAACCAQLFMRNCTMHGRFLLDTHWGTWPVTITNCAFDGTDLSQMDSTDTSCDYNAFLTGASRLPILGSHDVIVTDPNGFNWQSSWLGDFYLQPASPLIDKGSTTADALGLYHFTTQTNQVTETNSTVDIGYHYVAVDTNGMPLDFDADGTPDYLEDSNGDGVFDSGDLSDWRTYNSLNGLTTGAGLLVFTPLK